MVISLPVLAVRYCLKTWGKEHCQIIPVDNSCVNKYLLVVTNFVNDFSFKMCVTCISVREMVVPLLYTTHR